MAGPAKLLPRALVATITFLLAAPVVRASSAVLKPVRELATEPFKGDGDATAQDLSGIACSGVLAGDGLRCVVINDEGAHAQLATLTDTAMLPGRSVALDVRPQDETLGKAGSLDCPNGAGRFGEVDGEAVAVDGDTFFVVGSHGCGRHSGKFKLSSFQLIRFQLSADGAPLSEPQRTYRVIDLLNRSSVKDKFGADLETAHGLNIEGLAVIGDDIYFGLRGPGAGENVGATILQGSVKDLFAPGHDASAHAPVPLHVPMAKGFGVRDLAPLDRDHLLVLAGPETEGSQPYQILSFDLRKACSVSLGELDDRPVAEGRAKAEGLGLVSADTDSLKVVVLYDGLKNGGPQIYELPRPAACAKH